MGGTIFEGVQPDMIEGQNIFIIKNWLKKIEQKLVDKTYLHLTLSANQTGVAVNDIVEFDEKIGNIVFNTTTYKAILVAGKTYRLTAQIRMTGTSGLVEYQWYDYTNSDWFKGGRVVETRGINYSSNFNTVKTPALIASVIVTPIADIEVGLRIYLISNLTDIYADHSWGFIQEL